nr:MAG TPA: hypothetical protein [Caudoviricetes sp.]
MGESEISLSRLKKVVIRCQKVKYRRELILYSL